jgi:hypothetical protein
MTLNAISAACAASGQRSAIAAARAISWWCWAVGSTEVFYAIEVNGVALQVEAKYAQVLVQQLPSLMTGDVLRVVPESGVGVMSHATFRILRVGS